MSETRKTIWEQFVAQAPDWVGGTMEDLGDSVDKAFGFAGLTTCITGIVLRPNGDGAFFEVSGEAFDCGFDTRYGGIGAGEPDWVTFGGYGGHEWRIRKPVPQAA